jgi:predicted O-linked N-acetylglucosamine transferase (SPINDLY family)
MSSTIASDVSSDLPAHWQQQAQDCVLQGEYAKAASLYEQAILAEPATYPYYWQLGLLQLLQGQEVEAQTTWFFALADLPPDEVDGYVAELGQLLDQEAERQENQRNFDLAWAIRQHLREILPAHLKNLLHLVWLGVQLETLTSDDVQAWQVLEQLQADSPDPPVESSRVLIVLEQALNHLAPDAIILDFTAACLRWIDNLEGLMAVLLPKAIQLAYEEGVPGLGAELLQLYHRLDPDNIEILGHLSAFYQNVGDFDQGIATARLHYDRCTELADKLFASHILLRALMTPGGYWQEAVSAVANHKHLMAELFAQKNTSLEPLRASRLFTASCFLPYFDDNPLENRALQNQAVAVSQASLQHHYQEAVTHYRAHWPRPSSAAPVRKLKIGYLSHCMGQHSVGWLARWLIQHHDRSQFQLHGYFINQRKYDFLYDWYVEQMDQHYALTIKDANSSNVLADQINADGIDILIDLDSLTLDLTCHILSLKPAPIQVSWLGFDASGIPTVDYFIADPYVLPEDAQTYYPETIWRLPQTYLAVGGFEVHSPSLRRDHLDIPTDAVVYLSTQKGYKRHADTVRLQMRVLKEVPNSYFLIKGKATEPTIQQFFQELAEAEGVKRDRLRFLPDVGMESIHRADLAIADVVLDTFPYNGATTTLETLWMGVPLVTRVGQQFAARNSYTMLKNAGVEEGIAWTDDEYIEWGARLGRDEALRQQVHWKLLKSRQTAPLWNAKQFTREMEVAYRQMWERLGG